MKRTLLKSAPRLRLYMENECRYVSSRGLAKSTDIHNRIIKSSELTLDLSEYVKAVRGSILYVCNSQVHNFARHIFPLIKEPFVLVSGDSDDSMPYRHFQPDLFKAFVEDTRVQHWFCQNLIITHPKMTRMPIGLDYHSMATPGEVYDWGIGSLPIDQEKMLLRCFELPIPRRNLLCYSNFHHGDSRLRGDRQEVIKVVNNQLVFYEPTLIPRERTFEHQRYFSFVLSPAGGGPDCHRTWEALCLGCIPIVKTCGLDPLYEGLPVLIVQNWSDITPELLASTEKSFSEKKFDLEKLTLAYWVGLFKKQSDLCSKKMDTTYEYLSNGVIKQCNVKKIAYTHEYSNNYNSYGERGLQFSYLRLGVLLGALKKTPMSLLDVGYGNGDFLKVASQAIPHCYGADISDYPVPSTCKKTTLEEKRFYDVVCFFDSLEHFDDCEHIFISVPWCHHFSKSWFEKWYHRKPNEHLWHFNKPALISHFASHGYECVYSSNYEDIVRKNPESANYPNILSCLFKKKESILATFYASKTILVTGGTGFIGRHIVDALLSYSVKKVYIFDRTLKSSWVDPRVVLLQGDLTKDLDRIAALDFDILFHEAANVDTTCTDEALMTATNVTAFQEIVKLCAVRSTTRSVTLVYASSAATYGNSAPPNKVGFQENPLNIYGVSKLQMDTYMRSHPTQFPVIGLRYFNVYGNGEEHKGSMMSMISQMIDRMRDNKPVSLFEMGEQRRDFVYVKDVARCNLMAGMSSVSGIYNCGSGTSASFNEIFAILQSYYRNESTIRYIKNPYSFFQTETKADMSETLQGLGFSPTYTLSKGIYELKNV